MNKWFNKQTVLSFILGGMLFSSVGVFAATQLVATPNKYPIKVNNSEVNLEAYNINNRTYLQLKDVTEVLNADLNFKDNTILINTNSDSINSTQETTPNPTVVSTPTPIITLIPTPTSVVINTNNESEVNKNMESTIDNLKIYYYDTKLKQYNKSTGTKYIKLVHILEKYKPKGYNLESNNNIGTLIKNEKEILLNNIPLENIELFTMIKYDYYINNILPLLQ
jgi:FlaG/FlaF family flagellin (archaellin)